MTVKFYPGSQRQKSSLIAGFLSQFRIQHELMRDVVPHSYHAGSDPAVEVDGRLFVDPNVDALKKILDVE